LNLKIGLLIVLMLALAVVAVTAVSCLRRLDREPAAIWTPAPVLAGTAAATAGAAILPTQPAQTTRTSPRAAPAQPATSATPDPKRVVIAEADVVNAVEAGIGAQQGLAIEGLGVAFTGGQMRLTADRLRYGPADVRNLVLVGVLVAQDGGLRLETASISPGGLVTSLIPAFANQALAQYTAQWHVEEVRTLDGRLELRIR
jgi:hypothetical protein